MQALRKNKRLVMWAVIGSTVFVVAIISLGPALFKPDLRYERGSYIVAKDHATTSCVVRNHGRRSAEKAIMSVGFLSKILDIRVEPESSGRVVEVGSDQRKAMIELKNVTPGNEITVFFSVAKSQDKPFEVSLLDMTYDTRSLKERVAP